MDDKKKQDKKDDKNLSKKTEEKKSIFDKMRKIVDKTINCCKE